MYIVVEGIEGAGKTTSLNFIHRYLLERDFDVIKTREPGGTPVADELRTILKSVTVEELSPISEVMLMYVARAQLKRSVIDPALKAGKVVLSDRGELSSRAYQGAGAGMEMECSMLADMVVPNYNPDLTIYLDICPTIGLQRAANRGELDRIEQNKLEFFERARARFILETKNKTNVILINANQTVELVQADISKVLKSLFEN